MPAFDPSRELSDFVGRIHDALGSELVSIALYGSRARGDHRSRSDVDLMIIARSAGSHTRRSIHDAAVDWELTHNLDLSTKLLSEEEFRRLSAGPERFWRNYERDARQLWPTTSTSA